LVVQRTEVRKPISMNPFEIPFLIQSLNPKPILEFCVACVYPLKYEFGGTGMILDAMEK
jgi:hypothetical protein